MNFKTVAGIRDQKDAKNNPIKLDMFCVLDSMEKPDDYGNPRFKATDDNKNQRTVKFKGNTKPDASLLSHRVLISCWGKSYTDSRGQDKTSYEAWLKNANVSQTTPQNPPQQAQQPQQAKNAPKTVQTDDRNYSFALSYAKDMVCANSLKWIDFWPTVEAFQRYLETGKTPMVKDDEQSSEEDLPANFGEESKEEDSIPF